MSLVTRCPACATTFRVFPAQLSSRAGRVRCGKCGGVFDGVTHLLTEEAVAALPVEPSPQMTLFVDGGASGAPTQTGDKTRADSTPNAHFAMPAVEEPGHEPLQVAPAPAPDIAKEDGTETGKPVPAFLTPSPERAAHTLAWILPAIVAVATLALQATLTFRTEIAVLLPAARAPVEAACGLLGCEVRLPRRADLMSIESSDLQADTQRQSGIVLNALLRNRAPFTQEYPALELTLTDQSDQPVIRRVLTPADYLVAKRAAIAPGLGGGAEEAVRVHLDTGGLLATGYQLFLFYPCPPVPASAFWQLGYPARCQSPRNK